MSICVPSSSFETTGPGSAAIREGLGKLRLEAFPRCVSVCSLQDLSLIARQSNSFPGGGAGMGPDALGPQSCTGDSQ